VNDNAYICRNDTAAGPSCGDEGLLVDPFAVDPTFKVFEVEVEVEGEVDVDVESAEETVTCGANEMDDGPEVDIFLSILRTVVDKLGLAPFFNK